MLTTELTYYGNVNIRGNDTTAHAQKHAVHVKSVLLPFVYKILVVCITEVGAGTRLVMGNLHTYCTLCFMCMITSGCNKGAAGEEEQSE